MNSLEENINKKQDIFIIYYVFLNPNNNWKEIIIGQLEDIKHSNIMISNNLYNVNLEIVLSSNNIDLLNDATNLINNFFFDLLITNYKIININDENFYEYPGISQLYNKGCENSNAIFLYLHSKGMVYHHNKGRILDEKKLTENILFSWEKVINILINNNNINKVSIACSSKGWAWYNFFWVKGSYLKNCIEPIKTKNRYYYESWLGTNGSNTYEDCYNLINSDTKYYNNIEAVRLLTRLKKIK